MLKKMVIPGERIAEEESEYTDDTDSVESHHDIASIGDIGESSDISTPGIPSSDFGISLPGIAPSPAHTSPHGKAKRTKDREPFYKGYGVVYLPADINGLTRKLQSCLQATRQSGMNWFMHGLLKTHGLILCILEGSVSVIQNSGMFVLG